MIRITGLCVTLTLAAAPLALAQHKDMKSKPMAHAPVSVEKGWARASASANAAGAAYFVVRNTGKQSVTLMSASTPVAKRAELHTHLVEKNVMRMRRVDNVSIEPGKSLKLKPGGHHIMLMGLNKKLSKGDVFPLTLRFDKGASVTIDVTVGSIAAMGPPGMHKK